MTDLLIFGVIPDQTVRKTAQVAVTEEGHHLQTFLTSADLLTALGKNSTPNLVLLEPEANSEEIYKKILRHVPESSLCFMFSPGERHGSWTARGFPGARYLTKPILRRDIEKVLEQVVHSLHMNQV